MTPIQERLITPDSPIADVIAHFRRCAELESSGGVGTIAVSAENMLRILDHTDRLASEIEQLRDKVWMPIPDPPP